MSRNRVLMIGSCFPPNGSVGGLRTVKHCKYLPEFGWDTEVLTTPARPGTDLIDISMMRQLRPDQAVQRVGFLDPIDGTRRLLGQVKALVRGKAGLTSGSPADGLVPANSDTARPSWKQALRLLATATPDRLIPWWPEAVRTGLRALRRCDCLYSTAPHFTAHLVALALHKVSGLPWVADFRDPWVDNAWLQFAGPRHRRLHEVLEGWTVRSASAVVTVTDEIRAAFLRRYPALPAAKFSVIFNGFDTDDLPADFRPLERSNPAGPVTLAYFGSLYGSRSPVGLLQALRQLHESGQIPAGQARIELIGKTPADVRADIAATGFAQAVHVIPPLPRTEALQRMSVTDVLLIIGAPETDHYSLGTKTFEYLAAGRPILAVVPEGPIADLVRRYQVGWVVHPRDVAGIGTALLELLAGHRYGGLPRTRPDGLDVFTRRRQAGQLAGLMTETLGRSFDAGRDPAMADNVGQRRVPDPPG